MPPVGDRAKGTIRLLLAALLSLACIRSALLAQLAGPTSFDFEADTPGAVPAGWFLIDPRRAGISVRVTGEAAFRGKQSVALARDATAARSVPLNLMEQFPAAPYRGQRVRFRLAVRTESDARAHLWLRIDGSAAAGRVAPAVFLDNMDDRPITSPQWTHYDIVADVPPEAGQIALGLLTTGVGTVWIDDGAFEVVGKAEPIVIEGPRPLTARGLANVVAFSKLLGYVRHFHPSDGAAATDWDAFAVAGMRSIERAASVGDLVQQLDRLFRPIAPTLSIASVSARPPIAAAPLQGGAGRQVLVWYHFGFGSRSPQSIYLSDRRPTTAAPAALDVELGGGVAARIPLAVAADAGGTLPRSRTPPPRVATPAPTRRSYPAADRATRLAAVALAWNVLQHFYPYFDVVRTDWPALLPGALQQAAIDRSEEEFDDTLRRMIAALRDGHGHVSSLADAQRQFAPPVTLEWAEGRVIVSAAHPTTGLVPGDAIITVEGAPAPLALEDREATISGATPQWIRVRGLQELLAGPQDSGVKLGIERATSPGRRDDVTLTRSFSGWAPEPRLERIADLQPGIVYVDLTRTSETEFIAAIPRLAAAKGLVFDLRGYPEGVTPETLFGHLSREPLTSAQWHIPEVTRPDRQQMRFIRRGEWNLAARAPYFEGRKAFITNGRAISYAESCLGIVEHYRLAEIVGAPTAGTNGNVNSIRLPGGFTTSFTGMKVLKHDGSQHHGIGIQPTIAVTLTRSAIAAGRDELLERAIQAVTRQ